MLRHLATLADWDTQGIWELLELAAHLKREHRAGVSHQQVLEGKTLGMVFQKPSLRTRVSFEVGMNQLGGRALYMGPEEIKLGQRETTEDIAIVLSRYVDGIMARVFGHEVIEELARYATVPVINGLSDLYHPCQALGDMLTIWEKKRVLEGLTLTYIGDGNNVAHSLIMACTKLGLAFRIACPAGHEPKREVVAQANELGGQVDILHDPRVAAKGADVLYTDVWTSMGQEVETEERVNVFQGFTVDEEMIGTAGRGCIVLHCLPAHYGEEITYEASRHLASALFDQAENRLHAQKAALASLLD
ncbi:MAG: ornithine carbamoyltransferase [Candidatus Bipolaricaulota bacterium]